MAIHFWNSLTGHFKKAAIKVFNNGLWEATSAKSKRPGYNMKYVAGGPLKPNYSYRDPIFKYKYGWITICEKYGEDSGVAEVYTRIYNAIKYGDSVENYIFVMYGTNDLYSVKSTTTAKVDIKKVLGIEVDSTTIHGLYIYVGDTNTTDNLDRECRDYVEHDFPEFANRWCFREPSALYVSVAKESSFIIPYYTNAEQVVHNQMMKIGLDNIVKLVKLYYNIDFVDDTYENNNKRYTPLLKARIAKVIHDYIVVHCKYGLHNTAKGGDLEAWTVFSNYTADPVCMAYTYAFNAMCWRWGITAMAIYGNVGTEAHAWSMVCYEPLTFADAAIYNNDLWCEVDCTWDDPTHSENGTSVSLADNTCYWTYFNRTTSWLNSTADGHARTRTIRSEDGHAPSRISKYKIEAANTLYMTMTYHTNWDNEIKYLYKWE